MALATVTYRFLPSGQKVLPAKLDTLDHRPGQEEPNEPFYATIEILGASTGTHIRTRDMRTGVEYPLLPKELLRLIALDVIRDSKVNGSWIIYKQNTAYGIRRLSNASPHLCLTEVAGD